MQDGQPFPIVLLGAGASAPAEVPTAAAMTRKMMEMCKADGQQDYLRALNAIAGGLQMGFGQSEVAASGGADVEQVLNAASLLGDRFNLEFAPFVAAWHPIIEELERGGFEPFDAQSITNEALSRTSSSRSRGVAVSEAELFSALRAALQRAIELIGRQLSPQPDGALFRRLTTYLTGRLIELTWLRSPEKLAYLDPLLMAARNAAINVVTLNYDNGVELRAAHLGIPCETLGTWSTTGKLPRAAIGIDLTKLHGSVKWRWNIRQETTVGLEHREISEIDDENAPRVAGFNRRYTEDQGHLLAVIFGGHNKITAEGPFLDLLVKFKNALEEHSWLLVVGYSFRDPHVNHCIMKWLHKDASRHVTIVDIKGSMEIHSRLMQNANAATQAVRAAHIRYDRGGEWICQILRQPSVRTVLFLFQP
jgi:SIR2-like domain